MNHTRFSVLAAIKADLDAAHAAHPGSVPLNRLHARLGRAVEELKDMLTDEQYVALGGGTPKPPAPVADEGQVGED